jgi:hypothetical protein
MLKQFHGQASARAMVSELAKTRERDKTKPPREWDGWHFRITLIFDAAANFIVTPADDDISHLRAWGQKRAIRTIAQTISQPIHVMLGWAACHSRICLWMAIRNIQHFLN